LIAAQIPAPTVSFDARPAIAQGEEPLTDILQLASTLEDGDVLEIIAPFDPRPLYEVLQKRGFRTPVAATESRGVWRTLFTRVAIAPTHTVASVQANHPMTAPVFTRFGLDACCGGAHTLDAAASAHGVDVAPLLVLLHAAALGSLHTDTREQGNP